MSIFTRVYERIKGGWKTWGPNSIPGSGAFDSSDDPMENVNANSALKISAFWACIALRAETIGSLPLQLRDDQKNIVKDHDLYGVLHESPNALQTPIEFWSMMTAQTDMHGNGIAIIKRRGNKSVISLEPVDVGCDGVQLLEKVSGALYYKIGGESFDEEDVLHLRGFSTAGLWGQSRLHVGRAILAAQLQANMSAMRAFKNGLKVGGFFKVAKNLDREQLNAFKERLEEHGKIENAGKMLTLLAGMEPVAGTDFRVSPADAELLQSRYFGIEEICRLCNTPPQLIGHTDKASSWASSLENVNLFFLMYSLQPTFIRFEQRIGKKLMSPIDRKRYKAKFSIEGLLRADTKSRNAFYTAGLQNGWLNRNEVRDMEDRGKIEGGETYTIQLNMGGIDTPTETDDKLTPKDTPK